MTRRVLCPLSSLFLRVRIGVAITTACLASGAHGQLLGVPEKIDISGPARPVPASYFGMHIHRAASGTPWPTARFGSWRLWDARVSWPYLERRPGEWDFSLLDRYVRMAELMGVEPLLVLGLSPAWASARPSEPSGYGAGNAAEPRDLSAWRRYVEIVAARYKGRIRQYEIWNEINDPKRFYSGSLEHMKELATAAYEGIKRIDPDAIVLSPNITGEIKESLALFDSYLTMGGGRIADVVAYHFYIMGNRGPEALPSYIARVRAIMARHGLGGKPLWNTETGWRIENSDGTPEKLELNSRWWPKLGQDTAAAYVARALVLAWASGVERFFWYAWDNTAFGLMEPSAMRPKPAAQAFEQTRRWMTGKMVEECRTREAALWVCALRAGEGPRAWMVWRADSRTVAFPIPTEWAVLRAEPLGGAAFAVPASGAQVGVGQAPVLLMQRGYTLAE